ncbi:MAG: GNAT family N-acetyltransferase [Pseudomonadota bacterium]
MAAAEQDEHEKLVIRIEGAMKDIAPADWDACANPSGRPYNPFLSHAFLNVLETSGSVAGQAGWLPRHLVLEEYGKVTGCMAAYVKSHSQGEYVFDYGWADAYERAGGRYYPKLQVSVPFTPATGRRLLVADDEHTEYREKALMSGAVELCRKAGASSVHWTFLTEGEYEHLGSLGLLQRTDQQFHWLNDGYANFGEFLDTLSSRKRKNLRKERAAALCNDIEVEWLTGSDLTEAHWDAFWEFYMDTGARKWGQPYLTREFFSQASEALPDDILLILAKRHGRYIAGALNFIGGDTLFGRNWGCVEDHRFLHFELCYYQAIDFAIERGLKRVEAGAQGPHKLARGYVPVTTYSAHYIADPGLDNAVREYLISERQYVAQEHDHLSRFTPFKKG